MDTSQAVAGTAFTYDAAHRLESLTHTDTSTNGSGTLLAGYDFTWDAASRLSAVDFLPDGVNSPFDYTSEDVGYTYDARGQLLTSTYAQPTNGPSQTDESYAYDSNGNRQLVTNSASAAQTVINGPNNRVLSDGAFTYSYDAEGNRISRTNIATGGTTAYTWDHRNRLVRVEETNSVGTITQSTEHTYDAFNQWITREVDPDGETDSAAIERTIFAYDRGQIVLQFDGEVTNPQTENLTAADLSHRYLWGPAVDQLLADEQVDGNTTEGETLWALDDQLGSVRDLVSYDELAEDTELANHITYDSYGRKTAETDAAIEELFGYTGRAFDKTTGLQNNLNRWLDADSGKWLSEDPIGFNGGDANLARYVGNRPTGATDPSGLQTPDEMAFLLGDKVYEDYTERSRTRLRQTYAQGVVDSFAESVAKWGQLQAESARLQGLGLARDADCEEFKLPSVGMPVRVFLKEDDRESYELGRVEAPLLEGYLVPVQVFGGTAGRHVFLRLRASKGPEKVQQHIRLLRQRGLFAREQTTKTNLLDFIHGRRVGFGRTGRLGTEACAPRGLPGTTAESVADKLRRYLLDPNHPVGGDKAKWFREALGFTQDNLDDLARQIKFDPAKAIQTAVTVHGTKFNQVIEIVGANGKRIKVTFAWIRNNDGIVRLVTGIPTPR